MRSLATGTFVKKYDLKQTLEITPIAKFLFSSFHPQGNLLKAIDKKTGRKDGALFTNVLFSVTHFLYFMHTKLYILSTY